MDGDRFFYSGFNFHGVSERATTECQILSWKGKNQNWYIKFSKLLRTLLFGVNFEKVSDFVVLRTKAKLVLHIHSNQDLNRLFTVAGLSAFSFWNGQRAYHGAAKIHLQYGRRNYREYVMNKTSSSSSPSNEFELELL